jgi:hypothetical protein
MTRTLKKLLTQSGSRGVSSITVGSSSVRPPPALMTMKAIGAFQPTHTSSGWGKYSPNSPPPAPLDSDRPHVAGEKTPGCPWPAFGARRGNRSRSKVEPRAGDRRSADSLKTQLTSLADVVYYTGYDEKG